MKKPFSPMLAPNQQPKLDNIKYPIFASYKLDGIRCIFYKGEMLSRSLKPIVNKQLREKFEEIRRYTEEFNLILDGEIYSHKLTFQEITSFVMTKDFEDKKSVHKYGHIVQIPKHLKFYCFDAVKDDCFNETFFERNIIVKKMITMFSKLIYAVVQHEVNSKFEVNYLFSEALNIGYEGLILKDINGKYKCGRGTLTEGLIYKIKSFRTFDAKIVDVIQATQVDPNAEKKINELGRSITSKKKNDRILIDKASAFLVEYNIKCNKCDGTGQDLMTDIKLLSPNNSQCDKCNGYKYEKYYLKVVIAMTDIEKEEIWKNKNLYIGKWIEYKGMLVGAKDVPRHPTMIRFRENKNG